MVTRATSGSPRAQGPLPLSVRSESTSHERVSSVASRPGAPALSREIEVITAIVLITAEKGALPKLGEALAGVDGVSEVYSVTGDFDFVAMVRAREHDELADIVTRRIAQVSGVARTQTHVAFKAYSRHDLEAVFAIGAEEG